MSLGKLTSLSTQTLSLLLERQRLQTLPSYNPNTTHLPQINQNLRQLRTGILELEAKEGRTESIELLRGQYERMRSMLGSESEVEGLSSPAESSVPDSPSSISPIPPTPPSRDFDGSYSRYTDDPEAQYGDPGIMLQTQRQLMNDQDEHLDHLSRSINRQRDISLQINEELDVHTGLLEELDTELDTTSGRLSSARRRLDRVARGARNNGSAVTIGIIILILLALIIIFKTDIRS